MQGRLRFIVLSPLATLMILMILAALIFSGAKAEAQQNNFQFAPAPLPFPYFEAGQTDYRAAGTHLSLKGVGLNYNGIGLQGTMREASSKKLAWDGNFSMFSVRGDYDIGGNEGKVGSSIISFAPQFDLEWQFFRNALFSLVGYGGFNFTFSVIHFDRSLYVPATFSTPQSDLTPSSITSFMYAIPLGLQGSVTMGQFNLAPYIGLLRFMGGFTSMSYDHQGPQTPAKTSDTIIPFTTTTIGSDLIYVPWNLSLGALWQKAGKSGSNKVVSTKVMQLSWSWNFPAETKSKEKIILRP